MLTVALRGCRGLQGEPLVLTASKMLAWCLQRLTYRAGDVRMEHSASADRQQFRAYLARVYEGYDRVWDCVWTHCYPSSQRGAGAPLEARFAGLIEQVFDWETEYEHFWYVRAARCTLMPGCNVTR